ncbi:MAG: helix-turn-helix transcriptional regulator [Coxiellaceae bacterium]|nr:helix-turn-helix transcriptional regulator [Coxiellaceae bacterium]
MKKDYALGARIKAAMKAAGFATAKEFCEKYSIPYLTFAQHVRGRRTPTTSFLQLYSKSFGVTEKWLVTGEGHPTANHKGSKNKKIEDAFAHEISKYQTDLMLNSELLTTILEEVIKLKLKYKLDEKKCADIATNLYTQIIKTSNEKSLQKNMVSTFIKTYEATLNS